MELVMHIKTLSAFEVRRFAPMRAVMEAVKQALVGIENNEFEVPQRLTFGQTHALVMPVYHRPTRSLVTKLLSLDFTRVPSISGVVTWSATGQPTLIADAAAVTALRTGAIVGLAVDLLAPSDAQTLLLYGAGAQALDQVRAIASVRRLTRVTVVGRTLDRTESVVEALRVEFPGVEFKAVTDGREDIRDADIISCATPSTSPLFSIEDLPERVVVTAIGSFTQQMHEIPQELFATGCPVVVDHVDACLKEAGEVIRAVADGRIEATDLITLGSSITRPPLRRNRAVFKSVGVAPQDWAVMRLLCSTLSSNEVVP
jgi:ornithine cyclodeaminase